jgi:hypothetical protein
VAHDTVTSQVAFIVLLWREVTLIVALPVPIAVIRPVLLIVATAGLDVDHVTSLIVASSGKNVTVNASVTSGFRVVEVFDNVIPARSTASSFLQPLKKTAHKSTVIVKISFLFMMIFDY